MHFIVYIKIASSDQFLVKVIAMKKQWIFSKFVCESKFRHRKSKINSKGNKCFFLKKIELIFSEILYILVTWFVKSLR